MNNQYSGEFFGTQIYPDVPEQPSAVLGIPIDNGPNSTYAHPAPLAQCGGNCPAFVEVTQLDTLRMVTEPIDARGHHLVSLEFVYLIHGLPPQSYGLLEYSTDSGQTWHFLEQFFNENELSGIFPAGGEGGSNESWDAYHSPIIHQLSNRVFQLRFSAVLHPSYTGELPQPGSPVPTPASPSFAFDELKVEAGVLTDLQLALDVGVNLCPEQQFNIQVLNPVEPDSNNTLYILADNGQTIDTLFAGPNLAAASTIGLQLSPSLQGSFELYAQTTHPPDTSIKLNLAVQPVQQRALQSTATPEVLHSFGVATIEADTVIDNTSPGYDLSWEMSYNGLHWQAFANNEGVPVSTPNLYLAPDVSAYSYSFRARVIDGGCTYYADTVAVLVTSLESRPLVSPNPQVCWGDLFTVNYDLPPAVQPEPGNITYLYAERSGNTYLIDSVPSSVTSGSILVAPLQIGPYGPGNGTALDFFVATSQPSYQGQLTENALIFEPAPVADSIAASVNAAPIGDSVTLAVVDFGSGSTEWQFSTDFGASWTAVGGPGGQPTLTWSPLLLTTQFRLRRSTDNCGEVFSNVVEVQTTVGRPERQVLLGALYPNPAQSRAILQFREPQRQVRLRLWNLQGQLVWETYRNSATEVHVPVQDLPAGYYSLSAETTQGRQYYKLLVNH